MQDHRRSTTTPPLQRHDNPLDGERYSAGLSQDSSATGTYFLPDDGQVGEELPMNISGWFDRLSGLRTQIDGSRRLSRWVTIVRDVR